MVNNGKNIRNNREIRKRKRKMRAYICMGILCFACVFSFFLGRNVGILEAEGRAQTEVAAMEDVDESMTDEEQETEGEPADTQDGSTVKNDDMDDVDGPETGEVPDTDKNGDQNPQEEKPDIDKSGILLVNKENKLPEDYEVTLKKLPDRTNQAAEEAYQPMCDMLAAARKDGLILEVCSSYRDVERQKELFEEDMRKLVRKGYSYLDAYDEVARETMPPGYSEHSTGLAFDIVSLGYQILDEGQEKTEENRWLREHCAEFGFILRYPKEKEEITGVSYEAWHFRYVGTEAAEYIMKNGLTLEEFLAE